MRGARCESLDTARLHARHHEPVRRRRLWLVQWTDSRLQECQMFGRKHAQGRGQRHYVWVRTLFDPAELEPRRFYQLLTASVVPPRPIAWVSTLSADGVGNLAPYSFFTVASSAPPIVQFTSVGRKDSLRNIEATGEFVINLATARLADVVNQSSASTTPRPTSFSS